ncbi:MAG: hypothetical protein KGK06_00855 [Xanthomonadaceae bacterium]|nr:hypothetical protein [Xanthomonadaceae bacterium]
MRKRVVGAMGILLGGFMTCRWVEGSMIHAAPAGDTVYAAGYLMGHWGAHILGLACLLIGTFYLLRMAKPSP